MANHIAIGPAINIGGNTAQMLDNGKIQITNQKGRVKTLSQDQFQKQVIKNHDKIKKGENFEFKKDYKALKITAAAIGTAAIAVGVLYRKEIGKYIRNFTFKKFWQDVKDLFKGAKNTVKNIFTGKNKKNPTVFDGTVQDKYTRKKGHYFMEEALNTKKQKNEAIVDWTKRYLNDYAGNADKFNNDQNLWHTLGKNYYSDFFAGNPQIVKRSEL